MSYTGKLHLELMRVLDSTNMTKAISSNLIPMVRGLGVELEKAKIYTMLTLTDGVK